MKLQFQDPPEHAKRPGSGAQPGRYMQFAVELKKHPNRWVLLPSDGTRRSEKGAEATAQNIRRGKVKGFAPRQYETAVDGTTIYVRYLGEPEEPEEKPEPEEEEEGADAGKALAADIRAWALEEGMTVPRVGKLSRDVIDAYMKSHRESPGLRAVKGQ